MGMRYKIIEGYDYTTGKAISVKIESGRIKEINEIPKTSDNVWIAPGLVDLQVNGFQGINLNDRSLKREDVVELMNSLWKIGVTGFFPTVITNDIDVLQHLLDIISEASDSVPANRNNILGIHLEGPFISGEDGPRGAHPKQYVHSPEWETFALLQKTARGMIRLVTMSPEYENAPGFIEKCVQSGVLVAIGHTAASSAQIDRAVNSGATLSTHLGNATHSHLPRHEGYLWSQLASDDLWASIISDGFHLPKSLLKIYLRVKGNKIFVVSDTTSFSGLSPGSYTTTIGGEVILDPSGRLYMKEQPAFLAGSARSMLECIEYLTDSGLVSESEGWDMGSVRPMQFLGDGSYGLKEGSLADLVLFEKKKEGIHILETIKSGDTVYEAK